MMKSVTLLEILLWMNAVAAILGLGLKILPMVLVLPVVLIGGCGTLVSLKLFGEKWSAAFAIVCGVTLWMLLFANAVRTDRDHETLSLTLIGIALNGFIGCILGWMMWVTVRMFNRMFSMQKKQKDSNGLSGSKK